MFQTYIGQIEAIGNDQLLQNFNRGEPLQYRVHFPVTSPLPRLTSIAVNGNVMCYGPGGTYFSVSFLFLLNAILCCRY